MPKGTPPDQQLTRSINARILDEHFDYLAAQIDGEHARTLSEALRASIMKAQIVDRWVREGKIDALLLEEADGAEVDDEREAAELDALNAEEGRRAPSEGRD